MSTPSGHIHHAAPVVPCANPLLSTHSFQLFYSLRAKPAPGPDLSGGYDMDLLAPHPLPALLNHPNLLQVRAQPALENLRNLRNLRIRNILLMLF